MASVVARVLAPIVLEKLINSFDAGGEVKKTQVAKVHKGEYVLPAGVKPTKAQRKAVEKGKKKKAPKKAPKKKGKGKKTAPNKMFV